MVNTKNRVTELEIKFSSQEYTIEELNEVIISQQKTIDRLTSQLFKLESAIKGISQANSNKYSEEEPPPHY